MTYEKAQYVFGMIGLFTFIAAFAGALVHILWPGNRKGFEEASRIPLETEDMNLGGSNGR